MIKLELNEAQAEWGAAMLARIAEGIATGGVVLPELMAVSFAEYMMNVRGVTPPAKGARVVGSVDFSRGKATIDVDLGRAFVVTAKGAVSTLAGKKAAGKAVSKLLSAADTDPQSWYEKQRTNGRFRGRVKMQIDAPTLEMIRRNLHSRVGYLQSGWNAAAQRFRVPTPSWISGKSGRGSINVTRTSNKLQIRAENQVNYAGGIQGMQRRLNFAAEVVAKKMERESKEAAEKGMQKIIDT